MIAQRRRFSGAENLCKTKAGSPPVEVPNADEVGLSAGAQLKIGDFQREALST